MLEYWLDRNRIDKYKAELRDFCFCHQGSVLEKLPNAAFQYCKAVEKTQWKKDELVWMGGQLNCDASNKKKIDDIRKDNNNPQIEWKMLESAGRANEEPYNDKHRRIKKAEEPSEIGNCRGKEATTLSKASPKELESFRKF